MYHLKPSARVLRSVREKLLDSAGRIEGDPDAVIVFLCSSRSGSSMLYDMITKSPDVLSLQGEIEPFLKLTGNAQGEDGSNMVLNFRSVDDLRNLVRSSLNTYVESPNLKNTIRSWWQRLAVQWPSLDYDQMDVHHAVQSRKPLQTLGVDTGWYDGTLTDGDPDYPLTVIEEPPLVVPKPCRYPGTLDGRVAIFKTPQNVYRKGMFELLFPKSKVIYVHLKRSYAGAINGMYDGWMHPKAFNSYKIDGDWWSFDVPPGYKKVAGSSVWDKAFFQWETANSFALHYDISHSLKYEDIRENPVDELNKLCEELDIRAPERITPRVVMATQKPERSRWMKRSKEVLKYRRQAEPLMAKLGYDIDNVWDWS